MNVEKIREDFPILNRKINGHNLVYLDNAATTQKPVQVINAISSFYEQSNANIHRGVHTLSEESTELYESARKKVADFIGAKKEEIVFTRNATEAINLVRFSWGSENIEKNDRIIATKMEHHSNIVPWQLLSREKGAFLDFIDIDSEGFFVKRDLENKKGKLVAFTHMSNVLGTINNARQIISIAHDNGSLVLVDAAQSAPHIEIDVKDMDADFLVFSGHKMLGPTGIGVLFAKKEILEKMQPFLSGGDMIKEVHLKNSTWNEVPWKFEAGTPHIAGAVGLASAINYLEKIGLKNVRKHEIEITKYAIEEMNKIDKIKIYGPNEIENRGGIISFNIADIHSHDVADIMNDMGIAIRSGHHCAMPLMERLGICNAARASFYIYNTKEEIDVFLEGIRKVKSVFKV